MTTSGLHLSLTIPASMWGSNRTTPLVLSTNLTVNMLFYSVDYLARYYPPSCRIGRAWISLTDTGKII